MWCGARAARRVNQALRAAALPEHCGAEQTQPARLRNDERARTYRVARMRQPSAAENCSAKSSQRGSNHAHELCCPPSASACCSRGADGADRRQQRATVQLSATVGALQERHEAAREVACKVAAAAAACKKAADAPAGPSTHVAPLLHAWPPAIRAFMRRSCCDAVLTWRPSRRALRPLLATPARPPRACCCVDCGCEPVAASRAALLAAAPDRRTVYASHVPLSASLQRGTVAPWSPPLPRCA